MDANVSLLFLELQIDLVRIKDPERASKQILEAKDNSSYWILRISKICLLPDKATLANLAFEEGRTGSRLTTLKAFILGCFLSIHTLKSMV